jgi:hypothetical protein
VKFPLPRRTLLVVLLLLSLLLRVGSTRGTDDAVGAFLGESQNNNDQGLINILGRQRGWTRMVAAAVNIVVVVVVAAAAADAVLPVVQQLFLGRNILDEVAVPS